LAGLQNYQPIDSLANQGTVVETLVWKDEVHSVAMNTETFKVDSIHAIDDSPLFIAMLKVVCVAFPVAHQIYPVSIL
jgi:hypothetical protein